MIRIAVCDDDFNFVSTTLNGYIEEAAQNTRHGIEKETFTDGAALLKSFSDGNAFDIVILDIEMPGINGKETARKLRMIDNSFFLIFISSYPEHVFDTLKYKVSAFIPKESSHDFYTSELSRVLNDFSKYRAQFEAMEILDDGRLSTIRISPDNILGFYIKKSIIYMKTSSRDYILNEIVFRRISAHYIPLGFYECHRNYLVNISRISSICDNSVTLVNNDVFPVSRRSYKGLLMTFSRSLLNEVNR